MQKYDFLEGEHNINELVELDVEVYCGPFLTTPDKTSVCIIEETQDPCERQALANEKSKIDGKICLLCLDKGNMLITFEKQEENIY